MTLMSVAIALHSTAIRLMIVRARYFIGGGNVMRAVIAAWVDSQSLANLVTELDGCK